MSGRGRALLLLVAAATASLLASAPELAETAPPAPPPAAGTLAPERPPPPPPEELAARTAAAVVTIAADHGWTGVAGTGIVLTPDGSALTNHHVVSGATEITAVSPATGLIYDVEVTGYDRDRDIAVLQLGGAHDLPVAVLADAPPAVGSPVVAFGNADGAGVVVAAPGTLLAVGRSVSVRDSADGSRHRLTGMLQTDTAIRPGDSGGPLVDAYGAVVGVNTAGAVARDDTDTGADTAPEAYAVPIAEALAVVDQVRTGTGAGSVHVGPTPRLGVEVTTVRLDGDRRAVRVLWVSYGTPAYRAGLESGDVVVAFDGTAVSSTRELEALLAGRRPGESVRLDWHDGDGVPHTAEVVLEAGPVR